MARIGIYVERYTISSAEEMESLMRFAQVARRLGHRADFLFRPDIFKIPEYDAVYIRALTDPLNSTYVAARTAEMHSVRVIDDADSIRICCDKVNMYSHLMAADVKIPQTEFLSEKDMTKSAAEQCFERLGNPVVLKAPHSSFSKYVDRASNPEEFMSIGRRFFRRSDRIIAQRFVSSKFDWRVGVLADEPLYVCQYVIPRKRWKILTYAANGRTEYGQVRPLSLGEVNPLLLQRAMEAARAVGTGLYGVDLKQIDDDYVVIEVNDNPTILAGDEDQKAGDLYEKVVHFLVGEEA